MTCIRIIRRGRQRGGLLGAFSAACGFVLVPPAHAAPLDDELAGQPEGSHAALLPIAFDIAARPIDGATVEVPGGSAADPLPDAGSSSEDSTDSASNDALLEQARRERYDRSFAARVGAVKWETGAIVAAITAINYPKVAKDLHGFRFQDEGLFGRDTANLGVDKLAHAYNAYLFSEILYRRMERKTGGGPKSALTAAVLGAGIQAYGEIYDGIAARGFSWGDIAFNMAGAGFSAFRNSAPGMKQKIDFRISIVPNDEIYSRAGKKHFEQQRFLLALKASGFPATARTPLRLLEFHLGYYAKNFTFEDRDKGLIPQRKPFVGLGVNFTELLFRRTRSPVGRAVAMGLEYFQIPYTSLMFD